MTIIFQLLMGETSFNNMFSSVKYLLFFLAFSFGYLEVGTTTQSIDLHIIL